MKNKGFSLVELLVVIAIMVIVVGLLFPQLIKFLEKSNVSSDIQLTDSVRSAVAFAITDAKVLDDPNSRPWIDLMETSSGFTITNNSTFASSDCVLRESLEGTIGMPVGNLINSVKSAHGPNCQCNVKVNRGLVTVTLTETDNEGRRDTSSVTPQNDILVD